MQFVSRREVIQKTLKNLGAVGWLVDKDEQKYRSVDIVLQIYPGIDTS